MVQFFVVWPGGTGYGSGVDGVIQWTARSGCVADLRLRLGEGLARGAMSVDFGMAASGFLCFVWIRVLIACVLEIVGHGQRLHSTCN